MSGYGYEEELDELERYQLELLDDIEEAGRRSMIALGLLRFFESRLRVLTRRQRFAACIMRSASGYSLESAASLQRALRPAIDELELFHISAATMAFEAAEAMLEDMVDQGQAFLDNLPF